MDHIRVEFSPVNDISKELIIASLLPFSYEGFEEQENAVIAYIPAELFDEVAVKEIAFRYECRYHHSEIKQTNWNAEWEAGFKPVTIGNFAGIRAEFHQPLEGVEHEIVITPKMSFGTGHHATTHMMIEQMKDIDFTNKRVFDFGTGTGVLAIMAGRLGASDILATDYDSWSIENSRENISRNQSANVRTELSDKVPEGKFDIILANINKNVLLDNFSALAGALSPKGILVISGVLQTDENDMLREAEKYKLEFEKKLGKNNWICLKFKK